MPLLATLAVALSLATAQDGGPSFDCAKARAPVERAICADPELSRLDRRIAERYGAVRLALPSAARPALTDDQRVFVGARDEWFDNRQGMGFRDFPDLRARMTDRIAFLGSIRTTPSQNLAGTWTSLQGVVTVTRSGANRFRVKASTANPVNARWVCEAEGTGRLENGVLTLTVDGSSDGWTLRLVPRSGVLEVSEIGPRNATGGPDYCGNNGRVAGRYFPTR